MSDLCEVDDLSVLGKSHDDNARCGSRIGIDIADVGTDYSTCVCYEHNIVVAVDRSDTCELSCLICKVMAAYTETATVLHKSEVFELRELSVALFGDSNELFIVVYDDSTVYVVALTQTYTSYTSCGSAHCTDIVLCKSYGTAVVCRYNYLTSADGVHNEHKLVALVEVDGYLTALALIFVFKQGSSLDNALFCDHSEVFALKESLNADDRCDSLTCRKLYEIYNIRTLCLTRCLGDKECSLCVYLTVVCKEQER